MGTFHTQVKKATKIKMAAPKEKYLHMLRMSTREPEFFHDTMQGLLVRIGDSAFTVVFKSLIVLHVLMREGEKNVTIDYLSRHGEYFELTGLSFKPAGSGSSNAGIQIVKRYNDYLRTRAQEYAKIERDYVREGASHLKSIGRNQELLKHVESLELQIAALLKNRYSQYDLNNDMLMAAFKLLVQDVLVLYNALNEGIITLLESFFELSRPDAKRTLELYKRFVHLTENVVKYLKAGKAVGLEIPVIKHITTKLIRSLEDHLREGELQDQQYGSRSGSNSNLQRHKSEAQKQLEIVREQKRLLQEQLHLSSPLVQQLTQGTPLRPAATGYNPFIEPSVDQSLMQIQAPQHIHNPFASHVVGHVSQQTGFLTQPAAAVAMPQLHIQNPVIQSTLQRPATQPSLASSNNPFDLDSMRQHPPLEHHHTNPFAAIPAFDETQQLQLQLQLQQQQQQQQQLLLLQQQQQQQAQAGVSYMATYPQGQFHQSQPNQNAYLGQGSNLIDI